MRKKTKIKIGNQIKHPWVKILLEGSTEYELWRIEDALDLAANSGEDLVLVDDIQDPPICEIKKINIEQE